MSITMKHIRICLSLALALASVTAWAAPATIHYIYDEQGHVLGEYDANGNPIQEHVYLGDKPVAVVQGGDTSKVDYVVTDHQDTPRVIADSQKTLVWTWNSDPFGNGQPTGSISYNLRFPGQYYDAETGHNYNYFRDYDVVTGRYTESDPFGLMGGTNSYAYVMNNPLNLVDSLGLCPPQAGNGTTNNDANCINAYLDDVWGQGTSGEVNEAAWTGPNGLNARNETAWGIAAEESFKFLIEASTGLEEGPIGFAISTTKSAWDVLSGWKATARYNIAKDYCDRYGHYP